MLVITRGYKPTFTSLVEAPPCGRLTRHVANIETGRHAPTRKFLEVVWVMASVGVVKYTRVGCIYIYIHTYYNLQTTIWVTLQNASYSRHCFLLPLRVMFLFPAGHSVSGFWSLVALCLRQKWLQVPSCWFNTIQPVLDSRASVCVCDDVMTFSIPFPLGLVVSTICVMCKYLPEGSKCPCFAAT